MLYIPKGFFFTLCGDRYAYHCRHRRWSLDGTWEKILDGRRANCDEADGPGLDG